MKKKGNKYDNFCFDESVKIELKWRNSGMKTYDEVLKELEREIKMRLRFCPDWINKGKISQKDADHRLECLQEAYKILTENRPKTFRNGQIVMDFTQKRS